MDFPGKNIRVGCHFLYPGDLHDSGIKPTSVWQADSLLPRCLRSPLQNWSPMIPNHSLQIHKNDYFWQKAKGNETKMVTNRAFGFICNSFLKEKVDSGWGRLFQRWLQQSLPCRSTCIMGLGCSSPKEVKPISCPLETDWPALTNRMWRKWQGDRAPEPGFKRSCSFCFHCLGTRFSTRDIRGRVPGGLKIEDREIPEFHSSQLRSQTWDWDHLRLLGEYV